VNIAVSLPHLFKRTEFPTRLKNLLILIFWCCKCPFPRLIPTNATSSTRCFCQYRSHTPSLSPEPQYPPPPPHLPLPISSLVVALTYHFFAPHYTVPLSSSALTASDSLEHINASLDSLLPLHLHTSSYARPARKQQAASKQETPNTNQSSQIRRKTDLQTRSLASFCF
jgi:hypothetical protein